MAAHSNGRIPSWLPRLASALKEALLPELRQHGEALTEIVAVLREHSSTLHEHSSILREHTEILRQHGEALVEIVAVLHEHSAILQAQRERLAHMEGRLEILTGEIRSNLELHDRVSRMEAKLEMRTG